MIRVSNLSKVYGSGPLAYQALQGVDLTVPSGQVLMLVGPSGSGKTTLVSIIGCVLTTTTGSLQLLGEEVGNLPESALPSVRLRYIGFIFQSHNLLAALDAVDNVALPLMLRGAPRKEAVSHAAELLEQVGLKDRLTRRPAELSGGQRQRVAVARALAGKPPILLADEPTASLDAHTGQQVMETLTDLAHRGGHTVIVVTHDSRIFKFGDRLVSIEDGRIQATPPEVHS